MDIVVSGGSDPGRPLPAPRPGGDSRILQIIAVGVFLAAAGTAYAGWNLHEQRQERRIIDCGYLTAPYAHETKGIRYDDMPAHLQRMVDQLDCDVSGR